MALTTSPTSVAHEKAAPIVWHATVDDLARAPGNAELVDGGIVYLPSSGHMPNLAAGAVWASLRDYKRRTGSAGYAYTDSAAFLVDLPRRRSFGPDAAWHVGPPTGMDFMEGAPVFAVEVRGKNDYGPAAETALTRKRADYFAAGTLVVWDVDLLSEDVVRVFRAGDSEQPAEIYRRGDEAEAEPAVPDWRMAVADLFD